MHLPRKLEFGQLHYWHCLSRNWAVHDFQRLEMWNCQFMAFMLEQWQSVLLAFGRISQPKAYIQIYNAFGDY